MSIKVQFSTIHSQTECKKECELHMYDLYSHSANSSIQTPQQPVQCSYTHSVWSSYILLYRLKVTRESLKFWALIGGVVVTSPFFVCKVSSKPVCFLGEREMLVYFGPFWPILAVLSTNCAHFCDLFTGLNNAVVKKRQRSGMCVYIVHCARGKCLEFFCVFGVYYPSIICE